MAARVLRRLRDTTGELFVLVMREGVRDTTEQGTSETEMVGEAFYIAHRQMGTARVSADSQDSHEKGFQSVLKKRNHPVERASSH